MQHNCLLRTSSLELNNHMLRRRNATQTQRNALHTGTRACRSVLEKQIVKLMESISEQLAYESMPAEVGHAAALAHPIREQRHEPGCAALHCSASVPLLTRRMLHPSTHPVDHTVILSPADAEKRALK